MRNFLKLFGIIAMVAVIGFGLVGCDDGNGNGGGKTNPTVTWPTGLTGTAGQALSTVTIPAHTGTTPGSFSWTNPATVLAEATTAYNMTFTPTDTATYNTINQNVTITVSPALLSYDPEAGAANIGRVGPGGGIIYYYNENGFTVEGYGTEGNPGYFATYTAYYLEVAPANASESDVQWGDSGTSVTEITTFTSTNNANASKIGNGRKDTQLIVAHLATSETGRAAQVANNYTTNTASDWFLPSFGELYLYYQSTVTWQKPTGGGFWSSSQHGSTDSWNISFLNGYGLNLPKDNNDSVRAVRAF